MFSLLHSIPIYPSSIMDIPSDYFQIYSDFYKCLEKNTFKIPVFKSAFFARCILIYDIYELWQVIKQNWSIITKVTDLFSTLWGTIPSKRNDEYEILPAHKCQTNISYWKFVGRSSISPSQWHSVAYMDTYAGADPGGGGAPAARPP